MSTGLWVLFGVITLICAIIGVLLDIEDGGIGLYGVINGALAGAAVSLFTFLIVVLPCTYWLGQRDHTQEFQLVSAQDSTGVKGSFVWGSGSIDSGLTLNYYVKDGGAISPRSTYGNPTRIFEVTEGPYRVVEHFSKCSWWICIDDTTNWSYDLYVPPGSVVNSFNMDAK